MRRVAALAVAALVPACAGGDGEVAIACHLAGRSSVERPLGEERTLDLDEGLSVATTVGELAWEGLHTDTEAEGRVLTVQVTELDGDRPVASHLFQLDGPPANDFRGGHGFTGLVYAYAASGAELQWWCTSA